MNKRTLNPFLKAICCCATLVLAVTVKAFGIDQSKTLKPFTVLDSIGMTHFEDPPEYVQGYDLKYSPNRQQFLVVTEKGDIDLNLREYSLSIYNVRSFPSEPIEVAKFKSSSNRPGIAAAKWLDNDTISFIAENPGEVPQVYAVNCSTLKLTKITSDPLGVAEYDLTADLKTAVYYAQWSGDDVEARKRDQHGFAVGNERLVDLISGSWTRKSFTYQMFIMHPSSGTVRAAHSRPLFGVQRVWLSPDGKHVITVGPAVEIPAIWEEYGNRLLSHAAHDAQSMKTSGTRAEGVITQLMLVDTDTGNIRPLVNAPRAVLASVVWAADSNSAIVAGTYLPLDAQGEELARRKALPVVAEFTLPAGSYRRIADIPSNQTWRVERSGSSEGFIVYSKKFEEGDISKVLPKALYRKENDQWLRETVSASEQEPNIRITQAIDRWPQLVGIDRGTGRETVITDPNPQFRYFQFGHAETIHWTGKRGESLIGGLIYPTSYKPGMRYPLVIQTHGFSPNSFLVDGPFFFTTSMAAQALANKGIVVLQLGESPLYETSQFTLDYGPANLSQLESAVDYLDKLGLIERERVGLVGFSITGFQVRYALEHSAYHFAAATSAEGNDYGYWTYVASFAAGAWRVQVESMYGGPPWSGNWKAWLENSVSFNLDKIHTPLRLESESSEEVVNEWENFMALRRLNRPVELMFIPHGAHVVVKPWERLTSQQGNVDWMTFWLKGEEDADPTKAEQYARWREMRKLQESNRTASTATQ